MFLQKRSQITLNTYTIRSKTEQDVPFLWDMLYESIHVSEGDQPLSRDVIK